jgi:hypothetical protein
LAMVRAAAAAAVAAGDWALVDKLRPALEAAPPAAPTTPADNVRPLDAARRRKP